MATRDEEQSSLSPATDVVPSATNKILQKAAEKNAEGAIITTGLRKHPGSGREIPSCDRCRTFKKRCSRTFPACILCINAGQKCSFSVPVNSPDAESHHLRARIDWLTKFVEGLRPGTDVASIETGVNLRHVLKITSSLSPHLHAGQISNPVTRSQQNVDELPHKAARRATDVHSSQPMDSITPETLVAAPVPTVLPRNTAARQFIDAFFRNVNKAYPFVDRAKVLGNLECIDSMAEAQDRQDEGDTTLLYLLMAIGCTTLQRAGKIPVDTVSRFSVSYASIIQACLARDNVESLQILVALSLYSLFDAQGISAWLIAGIASRKAMLLGLGRKVAADGASSNSQKTPSHSEAELQRRLYWSIYILDRMMAISTGHPAALTDAANADIALPSLTAEECASPDKLHLCSVLQTNRHVIQLRQIEDRILRTVYHRKQIEVAALSYADRKAMTQAIRNSIEDWNNHGCLLSPAEPDSVSIHSSMAWQNAHYYQLLVLLYYPCPFNSYKPIPPGELLFYAQKHFQSSAILLEQRLLPFNVITLCRLLPISLVLLQGFLSAPHSITVPAPAQEPRRQHGGANQNGGELLSRDDLSIIIHILDSFPKTWTRAHEALHIFRQFMSIVSGISLDSGSLHVSTASYGSFELGLTKEVYRAMLQPLVGKLLAVMQDVLGFGTCYAAFEPLEDYYDTVSVQIVPGVNAPWQADSSAGSSSDTVSPGVNMATWGATSASFVPVARPGTTTAIDYNWETMEFGFI